MAWQPIAGWDTGYGFDSHLDNVGVGVEVLVVPDYIYVTVWVLCVVSVVC